jgi:4-hydroxybenzoate polyprenyltransferase
VSPWLLFLIVLKTFRHLLELIRFSHTLFALPFAALAAMMAWRLQYIDQFQTRIERPRFSEETPFGLLNNIALDFKDFLASPLIGKWQHFAIRWQELVGLVLCMIAARSFIASTLFFLPNRLPLYLSVPVLAVLAGYSFAKRFTSLTHFWLGAALALSPVAAWIAIRGNSVLAHPIDLLPALVLGGAVLTWVAGFDIIYACQDFQHDKQARLHSVPVALGIPGALRLAAACHLFTVVFLVGLPFVYPFGWVFWTGVLAVAVLLVYEHLLVRPDDLSRVNAAFFNVNAIISIGLFFVGSLDLLLHRG